QAGECAGDAKRQGAVGGFRFGAADPGEAEKADEEKSGHARLYGAGTIVRRANIASSGYFFVRRGGLRVANEPEALPRGDAGRDFEEAGGSIGICGAEAI